MLKAAIAQRRSLNLFASSVQTVHLLSPDSPVRAFKKYEQCNVSRVKKDRLRPTPIYETLSQDFRFVTETVEYSSGGVPTKPFCIIRPSRAATRNAELHTNHADFAILCTVHAVNTSTTTSNDAA